MVPRTHKWSIEVATKWVYPYRQYHRLAALGSLFDESAAIESDSCIVYKTEIMHTLTFAINLYRCIKESGHVY